MTCKDCFHYMPCGVPSWGNVTDCPELAEGLLIVTEDDDETDI